MLFCMDLSVSLVGYTTNKIYRGKIWDNDADTGVFKKKQPSTKKFQHAPEAPGPPVSMLLIITYQWPEQEWLFFWKAPPGAAFTQH